MDTSTPGSGSESSHECSPGDKKYMKLQLHYSHLPAEKKMIFSVQIILLYRGFASPHQFIGVFGPCQVADLRARVCALQRLTRQSVPEA